MDTEQGNRFYHIYWHIWTTMCCDQNYVTIITSWRSYEDYWYWLIIMHQVLFWTQMYEQHKKVISTCRWLWWKKNLKDIIDAAMVSTPEVVIDNSPNVHMTSTPVKKPSARKSLCLFTNILDVKTKTATGRNVASKSIHRAIKVGTSQWTKKTKRAFKNQWVDQT